MLRKYWWALFLVLIGIVFFLLSYTRLDPDFGWHMRMGEIISKNGIVLNDQLTYTMPSYEFVDFHWLSNVLMYLGYINFGQAGMAIIYSLLAVGSLTVLVQNKRKVWGLLGSMLAVTVLLARAGVRPQVESWFLFAVLLAWLLNKKLWQKRKWLFPVYMIVWANLHGGFFLAWGVLGIKMLVEYVESRKLNISDMLVLVLGVGATLINPYGWRLWYAVWKLLSDTTTKTNIAEWLPFYFHIEVATFFMAILIAIFGKYDLKSATKWLLVVTAGLFAMSLTSLRNAPFFVLAAVPLLSEILESFYKKFASKDQETKRRLNIFLRLIYGVFIVYFCMESVMNVYGSVVKREMSEDTFYPKGVIEYFKSNKVMGNIFTLYHWAGYMEWKMPGVKQYIDGRMPEWRYGVWPLTNDNAPESESKNAFLDYIKILDEGEYDNFFNKYNVKTVVLDAKKSENKQEGTLLGLIEKLQGKKDKKKEDLHQKLEQDGWKKVYEDKVTWVYERI